MLRRYLPIIALLCLVFLLTAPVFAQDSTPEATPTVYTVATVNGNPVEATLIAPVATSTPIVVQEPSDSLKIPLPLLIFIGIVALVFLAVIYLLLSQIIKALETMYPAGTVATMSKALGDGLERIIGQFNSNAPTTATNVDDFLLAVTDPLTKAIIAKLREQGTIVINTTPGENPHLSAADIEAIKNAALTDTQSVG